jgi:hypothetical protein
MLRKSNTSVNLIETFFYFKEVSVFEMTKIRSF